LSWGVESRTDAEAAEGPGIPDVRDGTIAEEAALNLLLHKVVNEWKEVPHCGTDL